MEERTGPRKKIRVKIGRRAEVQRVRGSAPRTTSEGSGTSGQSATDKARAEEYVRRVLAENARLVEDAHERMRRIR